jgi:regulatory protein
MGKYWTDDEGLENMKKYCVEQDRCQSEVRSKLIDHQIYGERTEGIIADLISEGYIDEQRFADSYTRGKFRMNHWGKTKIKQGLKLKQISEYCIKRAFKEIDDEVYLETLSNLLKKKVSSISGNTYQKKQKLIQYALSKGFENYAIEIALENVNF